MTSPPDRAQFNPLGDRRWRVSATFETGLSMLITANQPFGEWNAIFPDRAMTLAAVDRPVHHATIFEINVESYRRKAPEKAR
ncbi:MAG: ATP-binding protein [Roseovarius sp.]|nr:ATP-binding protein [Roseovarius sp.]